MHALRRGTVLAAGLLAATLGVSAHATTITINPSNQDTFIREDAVNTSPGGGNSWRIRMRSRTARRWRGLVQFDLSAIPQFSTINSATLKLRETGAALSPSKTHDVFSINDPWLQSTAKWSNQPTHAAGATASATVGLGNGDRTWTVTPDVQTWVDAPPSNHGWMIIDQAEGDSNDDIVKYVAKESRNNTTRKPKLDVDFTPPPCSTNADCVEVPDNLCTTNERCQAGHCAVDPVNCDDSDACTDDLCDVEQGCQHFLGVCNDGFDCTTDTCDSQTGCTNTPVDAFCQAEGCKDGTCVADPDDETLDEAGCSITSVHADGSPCNADTNDCTDDECLSGACTHPNSDVGTGCDDSNQCTQTDECDGAGTCVGSDPVVCPSGQCYESGDCDPDTGICSTPPKPQGEDCNDNDACTHDDECDGAGGCAGTGTPQVGCRKPLVPGKAFLLLKNKTPDKKDGLTWKWVKGAATSIPDFGAPLTPGASDYTLCIFDASANPQPLLSVSAPAGGTCGTDPCWKSTKKGYKYKDKLLDPDGVLSIIEVSGLDSKAKIIVKGKGANLGMPPLQPTLPVTVQLKRDDDPSICWDETYSGTPEKNLPDLFKAFGD